MPTFTEQLATLHGEISDQGSRVLELCTRAVEAFFERDADKARLVVAHDDEVDRVDVAIERASIPLLARGSQDEHQIRSVLTIVKVNNELERIADIGLLIAEQVLEPFPTAEPPPATFRVMANSVVGMLRDATRALASGDAELARQVLLFDDTVDRFRNEILLHAQERVALSALSVRFAFRLMSVTKSLERIADHSTNICEQVIYLQTGKIVRHRPDGWSDPEAPQANGR